MERLDHDISEAYEVLGDLSSVGIDVDAITQELEDQGVEKFITAADRLIDSLKEKQAAMRATS
jgi:transaldolase